MTLPTTEQIAAFRKSLQPWIEEASDDPEQKESREEAAEIIVETFQDQSTRLALNSFKLTSIPAEISSLHQLKNLELQHNLLTSIPAEIATLTQLKEIDLSYNQLPSIPPCITSLPELTLLHLSHNQIDELPAEIGNLTKLLNFFLSHNKIPTLPPEIGNLTKLKTLFLSHNKIPTLPPEIGNLTELETLHLDKNRIIALPIGIDNLHKLERLDIAENNLTEIRDSILLLPKLENLNIMLNRIPATEISRLVALPRSPSLTFFEYSSQEDALASLGTGSGDYHSSAYDSDSDTAPETSHTISEEILDKILSYSPNETEKNVLKDFLLEASDEELGGFRLLINKCIATKSWQDGGDSQAGMCEILYMISNAASKDEKVASRVNAHSLGSAESCGDRVSRTLIDVQLAALHFNKSPQEIITDPMTSDAIDELLKFAKAGSIIKFLEKKAEAKFIENNTEDNDDEGDEIETHLAYMQLAPRFGLELAGLGMLYRACSEVSDDDLSEAESSYHGPSEIAGMTMGQYLELSHLLDDKFSEIKFIQDIKSVVVQRKEFDTDPIEILTIDGSVRVETDTEYQERLKGLGKNLRIATIIALRDEIEIIRAAGLGQEEEKTQAETSAPTSIPLELPLSTTPPVATAAGIDTSDINLHTVAKNTRKPNTTFRPFRTMLAGLNTFIASILPGGR